ARLGRIDGYFPGIAHYFIKYSRTGTLRRGQAYTRPMGGLVKTEAIVLRSMRYGEADRILHVYTPNRGRIGAIAKGARRARSRFGGRLEPFFRLQIELHEGRGELLTVTGAQTVTVTRLCAETPMRWTPRHGH